MLQNDPKGWIPKFIVNMFAAKAPGDWRDSLANFYHNVYKKEKEDQPEEKEQVIKEEEKEQVIKEEEKEHVIKEEEKEQVIKEDVETNEGKNWQGSIHPGISPSRATPNFNTISQLLNHCGF